MDVFAHCPETRWNIIFGYRLRSFIQRIQIRLHTGSSQVVNLAEGTIWKQLIRFALPLLFSNFLQQLYSTADLMIVGQFASSESMAAVGSTGSLTSLIVNFFVGLGTGSSVVISQYYGAQNHKMVSKSVHTSITLSLCSGVIITVLGLVFAPILLAWMDTPADIIGEADAYLTIIFTGIIPTIVYNMGSGILRAVGDSRRPLYYLMFGAGLNIGLDILFVGVFGWGVSGAAIATVISQIGAMTLTLLNLFRTYSSYKLTFRGLGINWKILGQIVAIGVPAGLQSVMFAISNVVIQANINSFGSIAVAGLAAASRVDGFIFIFIQAFSLAIMTFVGQNIGAGRYDRVKKGVRTCLLMGGGSTAAVGIIIYLIGPEFLRIFNDDPGVIEFGMKMVFIMGTTYWIFSLSEILNNTMRGAGYSTVPMIVSLTFICGLRLLWMAVMLPIWNDIFVVILSYPISWGVTLSITFGLYVAKPWLRQYIKKHPEQELVGFTPSGK